jgi:hypothetical protein
MPEGNRKNQGLIARTWVVRNPSCRLSGRATARPLRKPRPLAASIIGPPGVAGSGSGRRGRDRAAEVGRMAKSWVSGADPDNGSFHVSGIQGGHQSWLSSSPSAGGFEDLAGINTS